MAGASAARDVAARALLCGALVLAGCSSSGADHDGGARDRGGEGITFPDGLTDGAVDAPRDAGDADVGAIDGPQLDLPPPPLPDVTSCTPDEFVGCYAGTTLLRCNQSGDGITTENCAPYACNAAAGRCNLCDPATPAACNGTDREACSSAGLPASETCPNGCAGGACTGCAATTRYRDSDNDTYGDPNASVTLCALQTGWVDDNTDCDDSDADAHPGQTKFFAKPRKGGGFDYDCDGNETPSIAVLFGGCGGSCLSTPGWDGAVPACGVAGTIRFCIKIFSCQQRSNAATQNCH